MVACNDPTVDSVTALDATGRAWRVAFANPMTDNAPLEWVGSYTIYQVDGGGAEVIGGHRPEILAAVAEAVTDPTYVDLITGEHDAALDYRLRIDRLEEAVCVGACNLEIGQGTWLPGNGVVTNNGLQYTSLVGSVTTPVLTNSNFRDSVRRWNKANAVAAGASSVSDVAWASATAQGRNLWRGDAANEGGFFLAFFGLTRVMDANSRCMFGLLGGTSNGPAATTDPSAMINMVALAADDTDANLQIMHNDGSGTATKIDTGIQKDDGLSSVYDLFFFAEPNGSAIQYRLIRRDTVVADVVGTISSNLPVSTSFMGVIAVMHYPGGSVAATSYALRGVLAEWNVGSGVDAHGYF